MRCPFRHAAAAACLVAAGGLHGQTSAPPASLPADQVVQLSEFDVKSQVDRGYLASETATGPRVATKIADLPYPISVITSEFMDDFAVINMAGDLNGLSASLTGVSSEGTFVLRGMTTNNNFYLRNGFYRLGLVDRVNTDRIEVIKGPNSAVYGGTNPSGMVNVVTKQPTETPYEKVAYTNGPYSLNRVEANINTPLGKVGGVELLNLISISGTDGHTPSSYPSSSTNRLFDDTLKAILPDGSVITAEYEWSRAFSVPGNGTSMVFEGTKSSLTPVIRPDLVSFNQVGPSDPDGARKNLSTYTVDLGYEKRWNQVWSNRIGGYWYRRPELQFNAAANSTVFDPVARTFSARSVQWDMLNQAGGALQIDTLADWKISDATASKTLFTIDYSQNWRMREVKDFNTGQYPAIAALSIDNPVYDVPPMSAFYIQNRFDKTRADATGLFLSEQLRFWNDRLIAFASLRRDFVQYNFTYANQYSLSKGVVGLKTPGQVVRYSSTALSPSVGYNYKVVKVEGTEVAAYTSYSQSFAPQLQVGKLGDPPLPNETARGWDYGMKVSTLDDKLVFTTGGYYINRNGIKTTVTDPLTGLSDTVAGGSTNSKGFEFEGSWHPIENATIVANYSYVNAKVTNNGKTTTDVGQTPVKVPVDQASFSGTYRFVGPGMLSHLSTHLNVLYSGRGYPFSTATTFQRYIIAPGYVLWNPGVSYAWTSGWGLKIKQTARLTVKNVFNRNYVTTTYDIGVPRGVYASYQISH